MNYYNNIYYVSAMIKRKDKDTIKRFNNGEIILPEAGDKMFSIK